MEYCLFITMCFPGQTVFRLQHALIAMGAEPIQAAKRSIVQAADTRRVCATAFNKIVLSYLPDPQKRATLAYCLAWLRVAGGNSVLPPGSGCNSMMSHGFESATDIPATSRNAAIARKRMIRSASCSAISVFGL